MDEQQEQKLKDLTAKAELLSMQQTKLAFEISQLQNELKDLAAPAAPFIITEKKPEPTSAPAIDVAFPPIPPAVTTQAKPQPVPSTRTTTQEKINRPPRMDRNALEDFIGTNLLNKIGIAVLVIGLGIGAKYAIDHDLINPVTRIILGYVAGIVLIVLAMRLKEKYKPFSAVLLSGGMATLYFMTFLAYNPYALIPQAITFVLMVLFTGFTVFAALQYNMKVIAIIGLVGAYAVPFLLSDGSGRVHILFTYMTIINIGILVLSFRKDWKVLYYIAFGLTWLIFIVWFSARFDVNQHLAISLLFSTIFFATFYTIFLAYKLLRKETLNIPDVVLLTLNTFIYYGIGYAAISNASNGESYLGMFTVCNALLHFIACALIYKRQEASRDIFYLLAGMVLVFLTLAVPVQFDGSWVTLIWAFEGALMFWIGRAKGFPIYEKISYGLVTLTFLGWGYDWQYSYLMTDSYFEGKILLRPFFNIQVLTSILVVASWAGILYIKRKHPKPESTIVGVVNLNYLFTWAVPLLMIFVLFFTFYSEIDSFWQQQYYNTKITTPGENGYDVYNEDYLRFNTISLLIYCALFTMGLWSINVKRVKNLNVYHGVSVAGPLVVFSFVTGGFYALYELRTSYLTPHEYFVASGWNIAIRYVAFITILPLLWINLWTANQVNYMANIKNAFKVFTIAIVLIVLSSELISLLDHLLIENSDRLALSILWGCYALALIVYGLKKDLKLIRIVAIIIFGITLIKLFLYDMSEMSTIAKTIVMVILGALLLVASFIYNKFKTPKNEA